MATEVLSAQHPPQTPQALPRESRRAALSAAQSAGLQQHLYVPTSRETVPSVYGSETSDLYSLHTNQSDGSQRTVNTEATSLSGDSSQDATLSYTMQRRARTPDAVTSPMSVTSPVFNGAKRTASGHVKNAASVSSTPYIPTSTTGRARAESLTSTSGRVGELAASLKMRLGYAMTKVQHGWEHKTIGELERLTSRPTKRHSMSQHDYPRSAIDFEAQPHAHGDVSSPPSKRRSGMFGAAPSIAQANMYGPRLQPAAAIHSHTHSRSADLRSVPFADTSVFAMSPPQTPHAHYPRRPQTIRTDTQTAEAERDALQALTQLGSPHTSQYSRNHNTSQGSSSQASPLRTDFTQGRRVSFARDNSDSSAAASIPDDGQQA